MRKQKKQLPDDDGRVIANMNVEGMPWFHERGAHEAAAQENGLQGLTKKEYRQVLRTATLTAIGLATILSAVLVVFVWICTLVW